MTSTVARISALSTFDPMLLMGGPVLLADVALLACYRSARRSIEIDPVEALRQN
jgi:ABC-type lipoprotein release transport system permease subunit